MKICSIPECTRRAIAHGWCDTHYRRWKAHGDATVCKRPVSTGVPQFYRDVVLPYDGSECLTWPFGRSRSGYAKMKHNGRDHVVSRLVCEAVNGPPPSPQHQAAHSCGRGHEACVARRHLTWKTSKENASDRVAHGTDVRGEDHPQARLSEANVGEIRHLYEQGSHTQKQLAERFDVSRGAIEGVLSRRNWSWLEQPTLRKETT